jgi:DNA-binding CsgD family transcriptional regulator
MVQGDHVRALTAARALGATSPDGDGLVSAQTLRAEAAYRLGELAEATEAAAAALAEAESLGRGTSGPLCASSRIDAMRGEHAGAERLADRAADAAGDDRLALLSALTCSAVAVSWGRGADAAWEVVGKAIASFEEIGIGEPAAYLFLPEVVTIAIEVGDVEVAERWQRWLEERGAALGRPYAIAAGSHAAGKLAASRGDLDTAIDAFESATMALARLQMPFELARSMLEQGSALRRRGAKRPARALLDEAEELFSTVGAGAWARRCAEERIRIGGRRAQTVLTEAEFRVARLAAGGRTNREIAATLFVSERTVESHLSHIYAKLDVRSRTELAVVFSASES